MYTNVDKLERDTLKRGSARQEFILNNDCAHQQVHDTTATVINPPNTIHQSGSNSAPATHNQQRICYAHQDVYIENQRIDRKLQQCVKQAIEQRKPPISLIVQPNFAFFKALLEWLFLQMNDNEWRSFAEACNYNYFRQRPHSIIDFFTEVFNISLSQSTLALGKYFGICPENIFNVFPQSANAEITIPQRSTHKKAVIERIPQLLSIDEMQYNLTHRDYQRDYSGEIEQAVCTYTNHYGTCLHVIASVYTDDSKPMLTIGFIPAKAKLFSSTDIDRTDNPTVIICAELNTALSLRKFAQETKLFKNHGTIISGYFGGKDAIQSLDYSVLHSADVVIIPTPTRDGLNEAKELLAKCTTAGVVSVKIFLGVVAFVNTALPEDNSTLPSWLQYFWSKSVTVSHENPFSLVATHIRDTAVSTADFQKWQIEHALAASEANTSANSPTLRISTLNAISAVDRDSSLSITADDFFIPSYTNLIWGPSNIGKTWVIVEICICVILGLPTFFLAKPIGARKEHVITILDGENEDSTLKQRFTQLLENKGYSNDALGRKVFIAGLEPGKKLSDTNEQEKLLSTLRSNSTTLLVIDNLLSLMPDATAGKSKHLFELLGRIKELGITVIVVHHAGKQGNIYLGSSTLESLSQNIIELSRLDDEESKECQNDDGAFYLKMHVTKCKVQGNTFANKMAIYTLPSGRGWQRLEGNLPHYDTEAPNEFHDISPSDILSTDVARPIGCQAESLPQLHPDDVKLYEFMKSKSSFTKRIIQKHLGVSETAARNKIKKFIDLGLIRQHGGKNIKNTYYTVIQ